MPVPGPHTDPERVGGLWRSCETGHLGQGVRAGSEAEDLACVGGAAGFASEAGEGGRCRKRELRTLLGGGLLTTEDGLCSLPRLRSLDPWEPLGDPEEDCVPSHSVTELGLTFSLAAGA